MNPSSGFHTEMLEKCLSFNISDKVCVLGTSKIFKISPAYFSVPDITHLTFCKLIALHPLGFVFVLCEADETQCQHQKCSLVQRVMAGKMVHWDSNLNRSDECGVPPGAT